MMMMMMIVIKANPQMPIWWQEVNTGCGEMNDDDDNMVAASQHWVW